MRKVIVTGGSRGDREQRAFDCLDRSLYDRIQIGQLRL
jgi:hypothetical protein